MLEPLDQAQRAYTFERLRNPKLFDILEEIGELDAPAAPYEAEGRVHHPSWPVTAYLSNVSAQIPDCVTELILRLKTENQTVITTLARIAASLPLVNQIVLVEKLRAWYQTPHMSWLSYTYLEIVRSLAQGGERSAALRLAEALVDIEPHARQALPGDSGEHFEAVPRGGQHSSYDYVLSELGNRLGSVAPQELALLFARTLQTGLLIEGCDASADFSSIWLRRLDDSLPTYKAISQLAHGLHILGEQSIRSGRASYDELYNSVAGFPQTIYERIRLSWILIAEEASLARAVLAAPEFYDREGIERERNALLSYYYPKLSRPEQQDVESRLRASVGSLDNIAAHAAGLGLDATLMHSKVARTQRRELYNALISIGPYLVEESRTEFASLAEEFEPDFGSVEQGDVWTGPTPPKDPSEYEAMSTDQLLLELEEWSPNQGFFAPSRAGLGRSLEPLFARRTDELLARLPRLSSLHPVYLWHLISAFKAHVGEPQFPHTRFLELLDVVRTDPRYADAGRRSKFTDPFDDDNYGAQTRTLVAHALSEIMRIAPMATSLRNAIWRILAAIAEDSEPTPESDDGSSEPWNVALNSPRGSAFLALFNYARWLNRHIGAPDEDLIAHAPELFALLDRHLDLTVEKSAAVRSTYGQNLVSIFAISRTWTIPALKHILPMHAAQANLLDAAWRAYLNFNAVYDETFHHLRPWYEKTVDSLDPTSMRERSSVDERGSLVSHVVRMYARGLIETSGPNSLLERLIARAPANILGDAIRSVGAGIDSINIPAETYTRLFRFYERVIAVYTSLPLTARQDALRGFGFWVVSQHLDEPWMLLRLRETLELTEGTLDIEFRVIERLADLTDSFPGECVACLLQLSRAGTSFVYTHSQQVRAIMLSAARRGGQTRRTALDVDTILKNSGIYNFGDVFSSRSGDA